MLLRFFVALQTIYSAIIDKHFRKHFSNRERKFYGKCVNKYLLI